ncbi:MAG TPA: oligosaccharide flippase family protein, partial [Thermoguttaceae bacterium]|nr:oligosaccharide flippase family protein [Thermoguttaceae bacterium]
WGVFWSLAGTVISRGLMLLASILVARILGQTVFGELGMIRLTIGMVGVFAEFGLGLTATKHVAEFRASDPDRAGRIIGISGWFAMFTGALMAGILFLSSSWLSEHSLEAPHLALELRIGALYLFISALNGAQIGALSGFEAFKSIARVNLLVGLLSFPILLLAVWYGGLPGAVWALTINLGINWLFNHIALRREARRFGVPLHFRGCVREWPVLWAFSLPVILGNVLVWPVRWICGTLLVRQPGGFDEMAILNAADYWYAMLLFLPDLLGQIMLPVVSEQLGVKAKQTARKIMILAIQLNVTVLLPFVVLLSVASPYIMNFYGENYRSSWPTLVVSLVTALLIAGQSPIGFYISASGRVWAGFIMKLCWGSVYILSTVLLLHQGALGLAVARAVSYVVFTIVTGWFVFCVVHGQKATHEAVAPPGA